MSLLSPADFPAVRALLDVSLDATALPDEVLTQPVYLAAAEAEVLRLDPQAESRTGAGLERVRRAAMAFLAALVAPAIPRIVAERYERGLYDRQLAPQDWAAQARELWARGHADVADVLQQGAVARRPTFFATACGRRGA